MWLWLCSATTRKGWLKNKIKYHCNISQNCVSKWTRLHLSAYSFQKLSGGRCSRTPLGNSWPSATRDFSPNDKSSYNLLSLTIINILQRKFIAWKWTCEWIFYHDSSSLLLSFKREGPECVKWTLGFAYFLHWDWEILNCNGIDIWAILSRPALPVFQDPLESYTDKLKQTSFVSVLVRPGMNKYSKYHYSNALFFPINQVWYV